MTLHPGAATGTLIGGNLNTMQGIWGTKYFPEITDGTILMIEDSLKDAATVERSFSLLKCAGVFERISGLILGKHENFDDMGTGRQPYEILQEVMGDVDFPVLANLTAAIPTPCSRSPSAQRSGWMQTRRRSRCWRNSAPAPLCRLAVIHFPVSKS